MLVLAVAALLAQGSACGSDQRTLARAAAGADCDLVTCPLRTAPALARLAEQACARCSAGVHTQSEDDAHVHLAAVADQPVERPWAARVAAPLGLDERRLPSGPDLRSFASAARDDSAPNRAPPSA
jgi:hypothetical protein